MAEKESDLMKRVEELEKMLKRTGQYTDTEQYPSTGLPWDTLRREASKRPRPHDHTPPDLLLGEGLELIYNEIQEIKKMLSKE